MPDFLDDFLDPKRIARRDLAKRTVRADYYDTRTFERTRLDMPPLDRARDELCENVPTGVGAIEDLFHLLNKVEPVKVDNDGIDAGYIINALVRDELFDLPALKELRELGTVGDPINAGLGVAAMEPDVAAAFDRLKLEQEMLEQLQTMILELVDVDDQITNLADGEDAEAVRLAGQSQSLQDKINAAKEQVRNNLTGKLQQAREDLTHGANEALGQQKDLQAMANAWGMNPGTLTRLNADERLALAKRIKDQPKIRKLASLIGRFTRVVHAEQRKKVSFAKSEIVGLETGDDLNRIVPSELSRLRHPKLHKGFIRDLAEGKLHQYRMEGSERAGMGSIVCVFDGSGSMAGDKECFAKAVAFALLDLAKTQKRAFRAIQFGWSDELREWCFEHPQDFTPEAILDMAEYFFNGGTDFMAPLSLALDRLTKDAAANKIKGDIVFITDGYARVDDTWMSEFKAAQKQLGFNVFGVVIGGGQNDEPLNTICDGRVVTYANLTESLQSPDALRPILGQIHSP